jgi:outer membrane lipoprotein SlyB
MLKNHCTLSAFRVTILLFILSSCSQPLTTREKSTLVGGGIGAATGAIIGAAVGSPGAGAAIGGAVGAGTGALVGDQFQKIETRQNAQQQQIQRQQRELQRQRSEISRLKKKTKNQPHYQTE